VAAFSFAPIGVSRTRSCRCAEHGVAYAVLLHRSGVGRVRSRLEKGAKE